MTSAKLHNEMVDYWVDLTLDLPPDQVQDRVVAEFLAEYPQATVFDIMDVSIEVKRRQDADVAEQKAIGAVFAHVLNVVGDIDVSEIIKTLEEKAAAGNSDASSALVGLDQIAPLIGFENAKSIWAAKQ